MLNDKSKVLAQLFLKLTFGRKLEGNKPYTNSSFHCDGILQEGFCFVLFFKQGESIWYLFVFQAYHNN